MANDEVEQFLILDLAAQAASAPSKAVCRKKFAEALVQISAVDIYYALFEVFQNMGGVGVLVATFQRLPHDIEIVFFRIFVLQCGKRLDKGA